MCLQCDFSLCRLRVRDRCIKIVFSDYTLIMKWAIWSLYKIGYIIRTPSVWRQYSMFLLMITLLTRIHVWFLLRWIQARKCAMSEDVYSVSRTMNWYSSVFFIIQDGKNVLELNEIHAVTIFDLLFHSVVSCEVKKLYQVIVT